MAVSRLRYHDLEKPQCESPLEMMSGASVTRASRRIKTPSSSTEVKRSHCNGPASFAAIPLPNALCATFSAAPSLREVTNR